MIERELRYENIKNLHEMWLVIDRSKNFEYYLIGFKDFLFQSTSCNNVSEIKTSAACPLTPSPPYQDAMGKPTFWNYEPL